MRIESAKPLRNGGWLHRLRECHPWPREYPTRFVVRMHSSLSDMRELAQRYEREARCADVERLARELGVSIHALRQLHIGWDSQAWTFPMSDASGRLIGIRRRFPNGRKLSVRGGREGLFVPEGLTGTGLLLVCEGPTDTAALLGLGFNAIGRPSCRGGVRLVCEFARGRDVVIVADSDGPGRDGAHALTGPVRLYCQSVCVISPPDDVKDARQWLQLGATRADVLAAIHAANLVPLSMALRGAPLRKSE